MTNTPSSHRWNLPAQASGNPFSPRALLYVLAGHVLHHIESLQVDYGVRL